MANDYSNMGSANTVSNSGHLIDYEFIPAVIVETDDPKNYGRVKVSAPGVFNTNNADLDQIPWCYPFTMSGSSSHASWDKGSKVWLFRNKKRHDENWFIPMYELHTKQQEFIDTNKSSTPEIVSFRNNGGKSSSITYDSGSGYNVSTGDSSINVSTGSTTTIVGGGSSVVVDNAKVSLGAGDGGNAEPAVLGNKLKDLLDKLISCLMEFMTEMPVNMVPWAITPAGKANMTLTELKTQLNTILSQTVDICEGGGGAGEGEGGAAGADGVSRSGLGPLSNNGTTEQNLLSKYMNINQTNNETISQTLNKMVENAKQNTPSTQINNSMVSNGKVYIAPSAKNNFNGQIVNVSDVASFGVDGTITLKSDMNKQYFSQGK